MKAVLKINSPSRDRGAKAFSLIEVVVAVGIFAIAIVSVIGLLGPINKSVADVRDFDDASRVVSALQSRLQDAGINQVISLFAAGDIFADRSGRRVARSGSAEWESDLTGQGIVDSNGNGTNNDEISAQKFFHVELARNEELSDSENDTTAGYLAFTITLRWPAYLADGTEITDASQQSVMVIPAAITR